MAELNALAIDGRFNVTFPVEAFIKYVELTYSNPVVALMEIRLDIAGFVETKPKMQITEGVYGYGTRYSGIKSIIPQGRVIGGSLREQIEALKPQQKPTVEAFRPPVSTSSPGAVDTPPSATKNLLDKMKVPEPEIAFKSVVKRGAIGAALIGAGFGLIDRLAPTKKDTNYLDKILRPVEEQIALFNFCSSDKPIPALP